MKKILISVMCLLGSIALVGCNNNSEAEIVKAEKHEITLSLDNYNDYIELRHFHYVNTYTYSVHYFDGALDYAYYDSVVVYYKVSYTSSGQETTENRSLKLNAGGYGEWYSQSGRSFYSYTVINVTGSVIYWL